MILGFPAGSRRIVGKYDRSFSVCLWPASATRCFRQHRLAEVPPSVMLIRVGSWKKLHVPRHSFLECGRFFSHSTISMAGPGNTQKGPSFSEKWPILAHDWVEKSHTNQRPNLMKKGKKEGRKKGRKEERKKGRKEERKKGRKGERKEGRKEGRKERRKKKGSFWY